MSQAELLGIAGVALGIVLSILKTIYNKVTGNSIQDGAARWLAFGLSFVTATVILAATGGFAAPPSDQLKFAEWLGASYLLVVGAATTIFGAVISDKSGIRALLRPETRVA